MPRARVPGRKLRLLQISTHAQLLKHFREELANRGFRLDGTVRIAQDPESTDVLIEQPDDAAVSVQDEEAAELIAELTPFARLKQGDVDAVDLQAEAEGVRALRAVDRLVKEFAALLAEADDHRAKRMAKLEGVGGTSWAAAKDLATKALRLMGATKEMEL
jgi:hypothetical protein